MTELLEQAFAAASRLPDASQDRIARAVLCLADDGVSEDINAADLPAVLEGLEQATRREFATDLAIRHPRRQPEFSDR